jgi:hypothetical protein
MKPKDRFKELDLHFGSILATMFVRCSMTKHCPHVIYPPRDTILHRTTTLIVVLSRSRHPDL